MVDAAYKLPPWSGAGKSPHEDPERAVGSLERHERRLLRYSGVSADGDRRAGRAADEDHVAGTGGAQHAEANPERAIGNGPEGSLQEEQVARALEDHEFRRPARPAHDDLVEAVRVEIDG